MVFIEQAASAGATAKATPTIVRMIILTPAAAATTLVLKDGGAGGTVKISLQTAASGSSVVIPIPDGLSFATDVHAILVGAAGLAYIGY